MLCLHLHGEWCNISQVHSFNNTYQEAEALVTKTVSLWTSSRTSSRSFQPSWISFPITFSKDWKQGASYTMRGLSVKRHLHHVLFIGTAWEFQNTFYIPFIVENHWKAGIGQAETWGNRHYFIHHYSLILEPSAPFSVLKNILITRNHLLNKGLK